ncbi:uncharacterized protein KY384_002028 [Bacidia gigantensis]|uniref:uncharacterized protein n=1 Tax=Bacidia gigantensis TaxID=2732470 RepID=UPI001D055B2A|nr:uncharacterized protein KY384_002028 [Bacidia gigantensis]KAG8533245.1 hypothetical protein KY384_002028 [Bacidia gigantensis]
MMNAPYVPQDVSEVSELLKRLEQSSQKQGGGKHSIKAKKHTYDVQGAPFTVDSWQFKDWDYKSRDLPTYARGLFTYRKRDGSPEIAVRGYDKFFNVDEVHETKWENVKSRTKGPYELSVKENGCIIFIAGLEDNHLLVCSKHSTGARDNADLSHAVAGERWVNKQLESVGRTRADLAKELRRRNVTAVAELCDDRFEEHVLAYEPHDAGLYLHGINLNLPDFATYSSELVHEFADEWGFKKAQYLIEDDVASMKDFLERCAETGSYAGRDTEGFVIRCERSIHGPKNAYQNWFFKYKFEEPYLMYRQWRECTKAIIGNRAPRFKKHKKITEEYLLYARRQFARNSNLAKEYNKNHGIIEMRDGFLKERGLKGSDIIRQEKEDDPTETVTNNVVLLPIASLGCGKTTVALALTTLFGWGHIQNDNITGKGNRPAQFTSHICNTLAAKPVCIGDRNNHQKRERKQIINDVSNLIPEARFIALHYVHDPKSTMLPTIRNVTRERIFTRGDNHQTIQAGTKSQQEIIGIMEGFLNRFEPFDASSQPDEDFDGVVDLDVSASSRENLETVVNFLYNQYPKLIPTLPSSKDLDRAIGAAMSDYTVDLKHDLSFNSNSKKSSGTTSSAVKPPAPPKLEFFCISVDASRIRTALSQAFSDVSPDIAKMYRHLDTSRRVQAQFHVTLMHRASINAKPELWQNLSSLHANAVTEAAESSQPTFDPVLGKCRIRLEQIIWNDRVMTIIVRLLNEGWDTSNEVPHMTIGTANQSIKPKESNDLIRDWLGEHGGVHETEVKGFVEIEGHVRAVMQRYGK